MKAPPARPLDRRAAAIVPSEAERSLLYAELIGLASTAASLRDGAARHSHAEGCRTG
ncbi:MAG TPA: hypothetical protein VFW19_07280 [Allosphingosinicella sp.]|nr:hypothetical protein [Allosphingosinicella sp.]